jgi:hypothetical protein
LIQKTPFYWDIQITLLQFLSQTPDETLTSKITFWKSGCRGEAESLISLSAGKYLPYDICIRLFG